MWKLTVIALLGWGVLPASAEILYTPVQYEYGSGAGKFYYGGSDPVAFARMERAGQIIALTNLRGVTLPIRTYSDLLPYHANAALFGYSANDARNDAYQSMPRYFRMSDIGPASTTNEPTKEAAPHGRGTIEIKPYVRPEKK